MRCVIEESKVWCEKMERPKDRWILLQPWAGLGPTRKSLSAQAQEPYSAAHAHYSPYHPDSAPHRKFTDVGICTGWLGLLPGRRAARGNYFGVGADEGLTAGLSFSPSAKLLRVATTGLNQAPRNEQKQRNSNDDAVDREGHEPSRPHPAHKPGNGSERDYERNREADRKHDPIVAAHR